MSQTHSQLLLALKVTVEALLERGFSGVWNVYGGLNRLGTALIDILTHGYKLSDQKGKPDLWVFIQGLSWLQPSLSHWEPPCDKELHYPCDVKGNKGLLWIYWHAENLSIGDKLSWLMSDREHILNCYEETAYLCSQKYSEALLVCIKALEQNRADLLADIDPALFFLPSGPSPFKKSHRRCSSFPTTSDGKVQEIELPFFGDYKKSRIPEQLRVMTGLGVMHGSLSGPQRRGSLRAVKHRKKFRERRSKSLPCLFIHSAPETQTRLRSKTISKISPSALKVDYADSVKPRTSRRRRDRQQKSFMEDGGISVRPAANGYFPRPSQGQSLTSFLSSGPFPSAELDRENAHFRISEAMISAIEQVKCNRTLRLAELRAVAVVDSHAGSSSDGGSSYWMRRRGLRPHREAAKPVGSWGDRDTTSEMTPSPPSSSDDEGCSDRETEAGSDAEHLALSLLKQFQDNQLPRASELEWLVAAGDTPQDMLPLPETWPIGPVGPLDREGTTALRGTADWAPPRPQLIFTIHPSPKRKVLLAKQNLRCAGCGCRVAAEYACRFRYCEYLGRYFCTACHSNQVAVIPARIIHNWDFNRYPVSTFSFKLIEQMMSDPLFRIDDLNPKLYKKVKALDRTRIYRLQLYFLKDFLLTCRFADHLKELLTHQSSYSLSEPDRFSLRDLLRVRSGELPIDLQALVKTGLAHVDTCDLCQARGFLCELCPCKAVIFPWCLNEVSRCSQCGACYHKKCFKQPVCPRCQRLASRRLSKVT